MRQGLAFDQLQNQELRRADFFEAVDRGNLRVVERGKDVRFPPKARDPLRVGGHALRQGLDGDVAREARIAGAIHLAHPTRPERGDDLVRSDRGTG